MRPQITINAYSLFNAIAQADIAGNEEVTRRPRTKSFSDKEQRFLTKSKSPDSIFRLTTESLLAYKYQNPGKKVKISARPRTASQSKPICMEFDENAHEKSWEDTVKNIVLSSTEELLKRRNSQHETFSSNTEISQRKLDLIYEKTEPKIRGKRVVMSISKDQPKREEPENPLGLTIKSINQAISQPILNNPPQLMQNDSSPIIKYSTYIKNGNKFLCAYEPIAHDQKPIIRPFSAYRKRSTSKETLSKQNEDNAKGVAYLHSSTLTAPFGQPIRGKKIKDTSDFGIMFRPDSAKSLQVSRLKEKFKEVSNASLKRIRFEKRNK